MKVVRIIARLNVGGPARHVAWLEAGLRGRGVESLLVAGVVPPGEDDMGYFAERLGVRPLVIPEMSREVSPKDLVTVWKLYRLLLRERPELVHTHTAKAGTVGRAAGVLYRWLTPSALWGRPRACRFVHTYHGHIFHSYYGRWKTRFFLAVEQALARLATDRIVVISPQQLEEINGRFRVGSREQFEVIPLGLDTRAFDDWPARRHLLRREWGAGEGDVLVGIVGRLTEVKNHRLFLEAAASSRSGAPTSRSPKV
jgi:glycosyltransferase involved in cell wall biosynthesis